MTAIGALLEHPYAQALSWALLHFVWQGAAIGLVAWLVWRFAGWSARARYVTGVVAMALMLAAPIATFAVIAAGTSRLPVTAARVTSVDSPAPAGPLVATARPVEPAEPAEPFEPFVLAAWLAGVLVLSARLLGGWFVARRFTTTGIAPVTAEIDQMARRLAAEIGLTRLVRLFESTRVAVPVTIGWVKPVVLLPMTALSGLSASQIEALIAHELAHIRRHDYLVNLLQSAVETLLFYHPAVWWVSARVRAEREDCCDDLAIRVCDRVVYVRALTDLASLAAPRLALAATDGSLMHRVRRILGEHGRDGATGSGWLSVMLALAIVGGAAPVLVATVFSPDAPDPVTAKTENTQVATGVPGGVPGGVAGGVPGGVAGGVKEEPQGDAQAAARALRDLQSMEAAAARSLREAQSQLEQERLSIEIQRLMTEHKSEREFLAAQMDDLKRQIERVRAAAAKGLATDASATKIQEDLRLLEIKRGLLDEKLNLAIRDVEVKKRQAQEVEQYLRRQEEVADIKRSKAAEVEQTLAKSGRDYQRLQEEYVLALQQKEQHRAAGGKLSPEMSQALEAKLERLRALMEEREKELADLTTALASAQAVQNQQVAEQVKRLVEEANLRSGRAAEEMAEQARATMRRALEARLTESAVAIGDADTARAGDIVRVELQNEPDLPERYTVQSDGTIRLPLVGSVKVIGLTPRQVQDAVRKQFTDRRLEAGASAAVSVHRPRTPRER
jgi:beta-lactamase regulating signal transducer with metallopeptidase domain